MKVRINDQAAKIGFAKLGIRTTSLVVCSFLMSCGNAEPSNDPTTAPLISLVSHDYLVQASGASIDHPLTFHFVHGSISADATYPVTDYNLEGAHATRFHVSDHSRTVLDKLFDVEPIDLRIISIEGGEQVVILDTYSGGAHCCFGSALADPNGSEGPTVAQSDWGSLGYKLMLSHNGTGYVFRSADDAMAYAFASFAQSTFPIEITAYRGDKFVDVTNEYPILIANDAAAHWNEYLTDARSGTAPESALVSYLADEVRLDREDAAWERVHASYGKNSVFDLKARAWLQKNGYVRAASSASSLSPTPAASGS